MAIENPSTLAIEVQILYDDFHELREWAAQAPDPEDVADDVVDYMKWLQRRPKTADS